MSQQLTAEASSGCYAPPLFSLAARGSLTTCARADGHAGFNYPFLTSKERDNETGLDYFGARYYASMQGRFISPDPLLSSGKAETPSSWNRYSYAENNPLAWTDPTGLFVYKHMTPEQRKEFEDGLKKGLEALKQYKEGSKEYKALKRSLVPFWDFKKDSMKLNVKDGITITIKKESDSGAHTDTYANGRVVIAFGSELLKDSNVLPGAIANEGYSVANTREGKRESLYSEESNSMIVHLLVTEKLQPDQPWNYNGVLLYDPSWAKADEATLNANRAAAVKELIEKPRSEGGYGYGPKPAKKRRP